MYFYISLFVLLALPKGSYNFKLIQQFKIFNDLFKGTYIGNIQGPLDYSSFMAADRYNLNQYDDEKPSLALDDFSQILDGLVIFSKEFGELRVPLKFEVPAEDPWPTNLHGLRLGKRLEKILSSKQFFENHPAKVKQLQEIGFQPSLDSILDDWDLILKGMQVYKKMYDHLRVPAKYVIPNEEPWPKICRNMKLGVRIAAVRSAGRFVKDHPQRKAELDALGFEWRLRDNTHKQQVENDLFDQIYEALRFYKENIHSDLNVPADFIVPVNDVWPENLWNLRLGAHVQSIRENDKLVYGHEQREKLLQDLGLIFGDSPKVLLSKKKFDLLFQGLLFYRSVFGDLQVPETYVVPSEDPWPEQLWGIRLGSRVHAIRTHGTLIANFPERREMLASIGFSLELVETSKRKKKKDSSLDSGESNNHETADGIDSQAATSAFLSPSKHTSESSMEIVDFSRIFQPDAYREVGGEAMREYMQGREYSNDPSIRQWAHFEGHLTPQELNSVLTRPISDDDITSMKKRGYRILEFDDFNWDKVLNALEIYREEHGHLNVPEDYVIDESVFESDSAYDETFEGLQLGKAVREIRIGDVDGLEDEERRRTLDKLGFDWGDTTLYQRYRFLPTFLGLRIYKHLYGYPLPRHNFVVPDEPQWPYWMVNMPLGLWASLLRVQQQLIAENYPERKDILNALEFPWWVPPGAIDKKYYTPL